jgi:hypothetical protein
MKVTVIQEVGLVTQITNETTDVHIQINQGPPGQDGKDGQPGPPNVLIVGSVITGEADTPASAEISGASPAQVLSLVIPRGAAGIPNGNAITGGTY